MYARLAQFVIALAVFGGVVLDHSVGVADDHHAPAASAGAELPDSAANAGHGSAEHAHELAEEGHAAAGEHGGAAAHHDSRDFNSPPLYFSLQLVLFTLVLFGIYFVTMKKSAWQPMIDGFNERAARVARAERDAATAKAEAARFHEQAEKRMVEVQGQVKEILAKARAEAESQKLRIVKDAELEATRVKEQALADIASAREQALQELSVLVEGQAVLASSRIGGRVFN